MAVIVFTKRDFEGGSTRKYGEMTITVDKRGVTIDGLFHTQGLSKADNEYNEVWPKELEAAWLDYLLLVDNKKLTMASDAQIEVKRQRARHPKAGEFAIYKGPAMTLKVVEKKTTFDANNLVINNTAAKVQLMSIFADVASDRQEIRWTSSMKPNIEEST